MESIFANEFDSYLNFYSSAGMDHKKIECYFKNLDAYLLENNHSVKELSEETLSAWFTEKDISNTTKTRIITILKGFVKYLKALGLDVCCLPEIPKSASDYVPYIFSADEFKRIIRAADMFSGHTRECRSAIQFPIALRILYGCGMRVGETLSLTWRNVRFEEGVLVILKAKNRKRRFVPMDRSLVELLIKYKSFVESKGICRDYVFESKTSIAYSVDHFHSWFCKILEKSGIQYSKRRPRERGPCPHCLRHLFTIRSFQKSAADGVEFINTAPVLSAYLGHDSIMETEKYLRASYLVYADSPKTVNAYIDNVFPSEVIFE